MKLFKISLILFFALTFTQQVFSQSKRSTFYEIKIYYLKNQEQEEVVDAYLKNAYLPENAYLPALNRNGIKNIGVFKPVGNDTSQNKRIYVLIPFKSPKQYADFPDRLANDKQHQESGKGYLNAAYNKAPYKRIESIFMRSFKGMPNLQVPAFKNEPQKRIYELRSYEAHTEKIHQNKVHMFNEGGEIDIFKRLGFNAIFYGSVLSGSNMPNLMYMTSFEDMASRDVHWKAFRADAEWKKLSSMQFYKNNVSKADILLLTPTDYSGI